MHSDSARNSRRKKQLAAAQGKDSVTFTAGDTASEGRCPGTGLEDKELLGLRLKTTSGPATPEAAARPGDVPLLRSAQSEATGDLSTLPVLWVPTHRPLLPYSHRASARATFPFTISQPIRVGCRGLLSALHSFPQFTQRLSLPQVRPRPRKERQPHLLQPTASRAPLVLMTLTVRRALIRYLTVRFCLMFFLW